VVILALTARDPINGICGFTPDSVTVAITITSIPTDMTPDDPPTCYVPPEDLHRCICDDKTGKKACA